MKEALQCLTPSLLPKTMEHRAKELLQVHARLWNILFNYTKSMSLKCAVELGIADVLHRHGDPTPLPVLLSELSIPPPRTGSFRRLMRLLVHVGIFARSTTADEEEAYSLTALSETLLVKERAVDVSPLVIDVLSAVMLDPWHHQSRWLTTEDLPTCFQAAHAGEDSELNGIFNEAMASDARLVAKVIIEGHGDIFHGLSSLVDVGGGNCMMATAIAEAFPQVKCSVLELPHVVASLEGCTKVEAVAGDMFEFIPPADAVLLKWVLHDWSDEECVRILRKCKEAIPPKEHGGKVIIIEMVMNLEDATHERAETQLLLDAHMMAACAGMERSAAEWRNIFTAAGFSDYKIMSILGLRSVIELYYPSTTAAI